MCGNGAKYSIERKGLFAGVELVFRLPGTDAD